jgi:hypothetical protein
MQENIKEKNQYQKVEQIDEESDAYAHARAHYKAHVLPVWKKHGLSPQFAKAVNAHVKIHGDSQVWNHHGENDGSDPEWYDRHKKQVRPLRKKTGYEVNED